MVTLGRLRAGYTQVSVHRTGLHSDDDDDDDEVMLNVLRCQLRPMPNHGSINL